MYKYVRPVNEVVEFNTKFRCVDKEDFVKYGRKSLVNVQRDLKRLICNKTVLIGQGLEHDLRRLNIVTVWAYYARYFLTSARFGMKPMRRNIWPGAY